MTDLNETAFTHDNRDPSVDGMHLRFPNGSPFMSREQVLEVAGVSYACLWGWMRDGKFPRARELGPGGRRGRIGWLKSEVNAWIESRPIRKQIGCVE